MNFTFLFRNLSSLFCVVLVALLSFTSTQAQWKQCNGPYGGVVTMLTANNTLIFAAITRDNNLNRDSIGLFRSIDNGNTWVELSTDFVKPQNRCISLHVNGNTLIGRFTDGIYCSTDNGDTWIRMSSFLESSITLIDTVLYTWRTGGDFLASTDNGKKWTFIGKAIALPYGTYLHPSYLTLSSNGNDFVSGTYGKGIYISTDKGVTWNESNTGLTDLTVLQVAVSGSKLFVSTLSGLFLSNDDGHSWVLTKGTPDNGSRTNNMLSVVGGTLFFITETGIYRSTDNGNSWTEINKGRIDDLIIPTCQIGSSLFGASNYGIFRSTDNGDTWISVGVLNQSINSFTKNGTSLFAGTNHNGVYRSVDNGLTWKNLYASLPTHTTNALYCYKDTLYLGTYNGVYRSWDNGDTWKYWLIHNNPVSAFTSTSKALFVGSDKSLSIFRHIKDTSQVWLSNVRLNSQNIRTLVSYGTTIIAGTIPGGIFRSIDDGNTWTNVNSFSPKTIVVSGTTLFAITEYQNKVYRSKDNGETWSPLGQFYGLITSIVGGKTIYVGSKTYGVFSSDDNGDSWNEVTTSSIAPDAQSLFVDNRTLYVGSFLSSVWKIELPVDVKIQSEKEKNNSSLFCSPNPVINTLTIKCPSQLFNSASLVQYAITSINGETLMETVSAEPQFSISTEFLASGVYFLTARQGLQRSSTLFSIFH